MGELENRVNALEIRLESLHQACIDMHTLVNLLMERQEIESDAVKQVLSGIIQAMESEVAQLNESRQQPHA